MRVILSIAFSFSIMVTFVGCGDCTNLGSPRGKVPIGEKVCSHDGNLYAREIDYGRIGVFFKQGDGLWVEIVPKEISFGGYQDLRSIAWSPNDKMLAVMYYGRRFGRHIAIIDLDVKKEIGQIPLSLSKEYFSLRFTKDGSKLETEGEIIDLNSQISQAIGSLKETMKFGSKAYSFDGKLFAYEIEPQSQGHIAIVEREGNKQLKTIKVQQCESLTEDCFNEVKGIAWAPSGKSLAVMFHYGSGGHISIIDVDKGIQVSLLPINYFHKFVEFSPQEYKLEADDTSIYLKPAAIGSPRSEVMSDDKIYSPDGLMYALVVKPQGSGNISLFNAGTNEPLKVIKSSTHTSGNFANEVKAMAWSNDSKKLAVMFHFLEGFDSYKGHVSILDVERGAELGVLPIFEQFKALEFSSNDSSIYLYRGRENKNTPSLLSLKDIKQK